MKRAILGNVPFNNNTLIANAVFAIQEPGANRTQPQHRSTNHDQDK